MAEEPATETVSKADYDKAIERARRFEGQVTDLQKTVERFSGIDPDDYKETKRLFEEMRTKNSGGDPKQIEAIVESRVAEIRKQIQKDIDALSQERDKYKSQNKELTVVGKVLELAAPKASGDALPLIERLVRESCDLDADGNIYAKGPDGKPLYAHGSTTKLMGAEDFVSHIFEKHPSLAKSEARGGTMQPGQKTKPTNGNHPVSYADLARIPAHEQKQVFDEMAKAGTLQKALQNR